MDRWPEFFYDTFQGVFDKLKQLCLKNDMIVNEITTDIMVLLIPNCLRFGLIVCILTKSQIINQ